MTDSTKNIIDGGMTHLSWCLIIAVKLARQEGKIISSLHEHMFIMQWLGNAQKYKLFPKSLAQHILWFQVQGKRHGTKAKLYEKAQAIWAIQPQEKDQQSALIRFTQLYEELKMLGWEGFVLPDAEWPSEIDKKQTNAVIYVNKKSLFESFDEYGNHVKPLEIRVKGNVTPFLALLTKFKFNTEKKTDIDNFAVFRLLQEKGTLTSICPNS